MSVAPLLPKAHNSIRLLKGYGGGSGSGSGSGSSQSTAQIHLLH